MAKQSIWDHEIQQIRSEFHKFVILRDIDKYDNQTQFYRDQMMNANKHSCQPLGPFNAG